MRENWRNIGSKIRYLRKSHSLTLRQLASGSSLSINTIRLIEQGQVAPTVETLCKIAFALGAPVCSLLQEVCPGEIVLTRASQLYPRKAAASALETIAAAQTHAIQPGGHSIQESLLSQSAICLCGTIEHETIDGQINTLNPGDQLTNNARALQRWRNTGDEPAVIILVLAPSPADCCISEDLSITHNA